MPPSRLARTFLVLLTICAAAGVLLQFTLTVFVHFSPAVGILHYVSQMTNWNAVSGLVVAASMLLAPRTALGSPTARTALAPLMLVVFILYEALLRGTTGEHSLAQRIATDVLHDVVPWLFIITWFLMPHPGLPWRAAAWAMLLPFAYVVFGMARGLVDDYWAYWFLNPTEIGWLAFLRNAVLINVGLAVLGIVYVALDRWLARRASRLAFTMPAGKG